MQAKSVYPGSGGGGESGGIVADGLDEVAKQQKAIGRNLNQIAMLAHEGRLHSVRLDELIEQHRVVTAAVCDIAKEVR